MANKRREIFKSVLQFVTYLWLCVEIGQFVQTHSPWGQNELYWPLWICLSAALLMGAKLLEYLHLDKSDP